MNWTLVAAVPPLVMLAFLIVTEWVPMFPFNDLAAQPVRRRLFAAAINYPVMALIAVLFAVDVTVSTLIATVLCFTVVAGNINSWWFPYFTGRGNADMRRNWEREYGRTLKLLPTDGHVVTPDAQHLVVTAIAWAMLITGVGASVHVL
ncbi:hypothetical protein GCM10009765_06040 [Fodinicola feengrottensis]|uniref:DUF1772 domain-containing protein n=1 Tax=Fodinicola feengrottensis TaxID=435914 RepID=A0ABN2FTW4_9ACTN